MASAITPGRFALFLTLPCKLLEVADMTVSSGVMNLSRVLHRLPDVRLSLDARSEVSVDLRGKIHIFGRHGLRLLEIFSRPMAVAEAMEILKPSLVGAQEWVQALLTLQQMESAGVLVEGEAQASAAPFDQASIHIAMLHDRRRTQAFVEAIRQVVRPGDVVADLGTGTGVLAVAAAQAGARKVYAIEAGAVGRKAAVLFEENGLAGRIVLVPGWSTQISLPEPVDVLVGELLGNDPFGEDILNVFRDGVRRLLKPGGKVLPARIELWSVLVAVPPEVTAMHRFETDSLKEWEQNYGIKFTALQADDAAATFSISPQAARHWPWLSQPVKLLDADMFAGEQVSGPTMPDITVTQDGLVNGMLLFFTAVLAEGIQISTNPTSVDEACHWRNVVRLFPASRKFSCGDLVKLDCAEGYQAARITSSARA